MALPALRARRLHARLRPLQWLRGPAEVESVGSEPWVVLDLAAARPYTPLAEFGVGIALARVKTPADAANFATRFGLLRYGIRHGTDFEATNIEPSRRERSAREPYSDFEQAARELREIYRMWALLQRAANHDREARRQLRSLFRREPPEGAALLQAVSEGLAQRLSGGLWTAPSVVYAASALGYERSTALRFGINAENLRQVIYLNAARQIIEQEEIRACADCGAPFVLEDGRQRFCTPACANRQRQRRFKAQRPR